LGGENISLPGPIHRLNPPAAVADDCPESPDMDDAGAARLKAGGRAAEAKQWYGRCRRINPACHCATMILGLMELSAGRK